MKKYAYLLILLPFILLGCKNPTVPEVEPEAESDSTTSVTAKELLENLPESIESFEKQLFSSNARSELGPTPLDIEALPSVYNISYYTEASTAYCSGVDDNADNILSALKNTVSKIEGIVFDSTCDISAKTIPELTGLESMISDSGYIKITYKDGLAKINWLFKINFGGNNNSARKSKGTSGKLIYTIIGKYNNGKFEDLTFITTQQAQGMTFFYTSSVAKKGNSIYEVSTTVGESEIEIVKKNKDGSYVYYSTQSDEDAKGEEDFFEKICLKTAKGYAYYDGRYQNEDRAYYYYLFDTEGSLLMEETNDKQVDDNSSGIADTFYQVIPLNNFDLTGTSLFYPYDEYNQPVAPGDICNEGVWYAYQANRGGPIQTDFFSNEVYTESFDLSNGETAYYPCLVNKGKTDLANIDFTTEQTAVTENLSIKSEVKDKIINLIQSVEKEKAARSEYIESVPSKKIIFGYAEEIEAWSNTIN